MTGYLLARQAPVPALTVAQFAAATGLDPFEVTRLIALGLLDAVRGPAGPVLPATQLARAAPHHPAAGRAGPELHRARGGPRPARAHRPPGGRTACRTQRPERTVEVIS